MLTILIVAIAVMSLVADCVGVLVNLIGPCTKLGDDGKHVK